jgi:uncharacterized protein (DUF1499 family)
MNRFVCLLVAILIVLGCSGSRPSFVAEGDKLAPCPETPNCVSTLSTDTQHAIAPLTYTGSLEEAMQILIAVVDAMPRTEVVTAKGSYLYVEFTTKVWRFVDDVEFILDDEHKVINFRSASRLGKSDLGVNRKRMEEVRSRFAQRMPQTAVK